RLGERARREVPEGREPHHGPRSSNGRPPHSGGGSTFCSAGKRYSGRRVGPKRGALPSALASSAFSTFSGVIGVSSTRTPTASYTALAMAGITGRSGPWPTSLAPNGASGSSVSTRKVWISGVSNVVGLL